MKINLRSSAELLISVVTHGVLASGLFARNGVPRSAQTRRFSTVFAGLRKIKPQFRGSARKSRGLDPADVSAWLGWTELTAGRPLRGVGPE